MAVGSGRPPRGRPRSGWRRSKTGAPATPRRRRARGGELRDRRAPAGRPRGGGRGQSIKGGGAPSSGVRSTRRRWVTPRLEHVGGGGSMGLHEALADPGPAVAEVVLEDVLEAHRVDLSWGGPPAASLAGAPRARRASCLASRRAAVVSSAGRVCGTMGPYTSTARAPPAGPGASPRRWCAYRRATSSRRLDEREREEEDHRGLARGVAPGSLEHEARGDREEHGHKVADVLVLVRHEERTPAQHEHHGRHESPPPERSQHADEAEDQQHGVVAEERPAEAREGGAPQPEDDLLRAEGDLGLVLSYELLGRHVGLEPVAHQVGVPGREGQRPEEAHREEAPRELPLEGPTEAQLPAAGWDGRSLGERRHQPGEPHHPEGESAGLVHREGDRGGRRASSRPAGAGGGVGGPCPRRWRRWPRPWGPRPLLHGELQVQQGGGAEHRGDPGAGAQVGRARGHQDEQWGARRDQGEHDLRQQVACHGNSFRTRPYSSPLLQSPCTYPMAKSAA